jgi:sRNA-binding regulator protein Hfq
MAHKKRKSAEGAAPNKDLSPLQVVWFTTLKERGDIVDIVLRSGHRLRGSVIDNAMYNILIRQEKTDQQMVVMKIGIATITVSRRIALVKGGSQVTHMKHRDVMDASPYRTGGGEV